MVVSEKPRAGSMLPEADPAANGVDPERLERLYTLIESQIAEGRYPGAQVAMARNGKLLAARTFGRARLDPSPAPASAETVWRLNSQTKVITAATAWVLVERGALRFADRISDHVPEFAKNGKGEITLFEVLTHQGGFPSANVPEEAWADHELLRRSVCDFTLEWTPGSRVHYHGGSAHWVTAVLIEAVTGRDFREVIRSELLDPIGLSDVFVGVPEGEQGRCADMHEAKDGRMQLTPQGNSTAFRAAGIPGGGGYATATGMAALYQMLLAGGVLNGVRVLGPRVIQFATRNHTGDRVDGQMQMPMHRGLGPHVRGTTPTIRGLGTIATPTTYGHGGAGSSYSWADPESGVSFSYLTNAACEEPWHTARLDRISNLAHAAIVE
jgi:CubicO group peptidase (beta-lactamase class C family)